LAEIKYWIISLEIVLFFDKYLCDIVVIFLYSPTIFISSFVYGEFNADDDLVNRHFIHIFLLFVNEYKKSILKFDV